MSVQPFLPLTIPRHNLSSQAAAAASLSFNFLSELTPIAFYNSTKSKLYHVNALSIGIYIKMGNSSTKRRLRLTILKAFSVHLNI